MLGRFKEKLFANQSLRTLTQEGGRLPEKTVKIFATQRLTRRGGSWREIIFLEFLKKGKLTQSR
jgi:hypothetical protein